ncbi:MAG: hypothetical protein JW715_11185 [Sedimentisphaerales bacterium]|nr:hypothetical protein [Sedimentisphaerales bacterium]
MQERWNIKIIVWILKNGRHHVKDIFLRIVLLLLLSFLIVSCSTVTESGKQHGVNAGQISLDLKPAVKRFNEVISKVDGKTSRQFTYTRTLPDGNIETIWFSTEAGNMKEIKSGTYEQNGVLRKTTVTPNGETKTENFDMITRFATNLNNRAQVVCYELLRPQGEQGNYKVNGPWDVKLVNSDGIWIGFSAEKAKSRKTGSWLSNEWHTSSSGEVYGIRQYLGEPSVIVKETTETP